LVGLSDDGTAHTGDEGPVGYARRSADRNSEKTEVSSSGRGGGGKAHVGGGRDCSPLVEEVG